MTTSTTIKQIIKSGVIFGAALQGAYAANVVEQPGKADIDIDAANPDPDIVITDGGSAGNYGLEFKLDTDADYTGVISSSIWVYAAKSGLGTLSLTNSNSFVAELSVLEGGLALDGVQVVHPLFQFVQGTATTISVNGATQISALGGDAGAMLILNSELTLDQTRDTSYAGDISGNGQLTKQGIGLLSLSGNNSNTGGLVIDGGSVQLLAQGAASGDIQNNASLILGDPNVRHLFSNTISGTGDLYILDDSIIDLTGTNSYTGTTYLGDGSTLFTSANSMVGDTSLGANSVVEFDQTVDGVYAGSITGDDGMVIKGGAANLSLTGMTDFNGLLYISTGSVSLDQQNSAASTLDILQLADTTVTINADTHVDRIVTSSLAAHETANLQLNADLTLQGGSGGYYEGDISGTGMLTIDTQNTTVTLTGTNDYTGGTHVESGYLSGNADSIQGDVQVDSTLTFNQMVDGTSDANLSGSGFVYKYGDGELALTGQHNLTGRVYLFGGSLSGDADSLNMNIYASTGTQIVFSQTTDGTHNSSLNGTLDVTKTGAGNLTMAGRVWGSGQFNLDEGQLTVATDLFNMSVVNLGTLVFDNQYDLYVYGNISGTGDLIKTSDLKATLAGFNTYTGGTTILGGVLAGNATSLQGMITNNATIQFEQYSDGDFAGVIDGSGDLIKSGDAALHLSQAQLYTGTTYIEAGTLVLDGNDLLAANSDIQIDEDGTLSIAGQQELQGLTNNGTLRVDGTLDFNLQAAMSLDGTLTGAGQIDKGSDFNLTLVNDSTFSGTFNLEQGSLGSDTDHQQMTLNLLSGTQLYGNGTYGAINVNDATIGPGNSIGTITVAGDLSFDADSIYNVEVDTLGGSDLISVQGQATLGGTLQVSPMAGEYSAYTQYQVLTAVNGFNGTTFDTVTSDFAFLDPNLIYGSTDVTLELIRNDVSFGDVGSTPNQAATGSALAQLFSADTAFTAPIYNQLITMTSDQAAAALTNLSGDLYADVQLASLGRSQRALQAQSFDAQGQDLWVRVDNLSGDLSSPHTASSYDSKRVAIGGMLSTGVDGLRVGGFVEHVTGDIKGTQLVADSSGDGGGLIAHWQFGQWRLSSTLAMGSDSSDTVRTFEVGSLLDTATATVDTSYVSGQAKLGYQLATTMGKFTPYAAVQQHQLKRKGFNEVSDYYALNGVKIDQSVSMIDIGVDFNFDLSQNTDSKLPTLMANVGYSHVLNDEIDQLFAISQQPSIDYRLSNSLIESRVYLQLQAGWQPSPTLSVGANISANYADKGQNQSLSLWASKRW